MALNISEVKKWVEKNIHQIRAHRDIANQFNISLETLRKEFLRKERKNLHAFVVETRVLKAKLLLEQTNNPCYEICFDVGFTREDTGAKTFKRITGLSMEAYRRQQRKVVMP